MRPKIEHRAEQRKDVKTKNDGNGEKNEFQLSCVKYCCLQMGSDSERKHHVVGALKNFCDLHEYAHFLG
jgi:hypothetical protein